MTDSLKSRVISSVLDLTGLIKNCLILIPGRMFVKQDLICGKGCQVYFSFILKAYYRLNQILKQVYILNY